MDSSESSERTDLVPSRSSDLRSWAGRTLDRAAEVGRARVTPRRVGAWLLVVLALLLPSAAFGVVTASAEANLGPHLARYDVTADGLVTVDLGPLGAVVIDSPLPLPLGTRVVVQEIPREITDLGRVGTLDEIGADLERYVQFFSAPEATLDVVVRALVADAVVRTLAMTGALLAVLVVVRWLMGPARRREVATTVRHHPLTLAVVVALVLAAGGTAVTAGGTVVPERERLGPPAAVFDGTALEGAVITGRLAGVVDTYGGQVLGAYRDNEDFYDQAAQNVRDAWAERERAQEAVTAAREASGQVRPRRADAPDLVTMLHVADLHCNVGMGRVMTAAIEESGATVVLNAGDTTMNGTPVEAYCVTAFAQAVPRGVTTVVADGNHDSPETAAQERAAGWVVLDGRVVDVQGVRIIGDADPRATRVGVGTVLVGDETVPEVGARLRDVACADARGVDILLSHDVRLGNETLRSGCAPAQLSGHYHRRIGPDRYGSGVRYVNASTAGAALGRPTVGPLNGVAEMTVLRFDPETRRIVDHRLVRVEPDLSATVSYWLDWPTDSPPPVTPPRRPDAPL